MDATTVLVPRVRCDDCYEPTLEEATIQYISDHRLSGEEDLTEGDRAEILEKVQYSLENEGGTFCTDHWAAAAE